RRACVYPLETLSAGYFGGTPKGVRASMRRWVSALLGSRWTRAALALGLAGGCAAAVAATQDAPAGGGLLGVRFGGDSHETRMVFDLDRTVTAKVAEAELPGKLTLTLTGAGAARALQGEGQGLIKGWRVVNQAGGAKVSIDLAAAAQVRRRFLLPPADGVTHYRYVVDLAALEAATPAQVALAQPAVSPT